VKVAMKTKKPFRMFTKPNPTLKYTHLKSPTD